MFVRFIPLRSSILDSRLPSTLLYFSLDWLLEIFNFVTEFTNQDISTGNISNVTNHNAFLQIQTQAILKPNGYNDVVFYSQEGKTYRAPGLKNS